MVTTEKKRGRTKAVPRRISGRDRGGALRYYGDFRHLGGPRGEALVAPGESFATTDPDIAAALFAERLKFWEGRRTAKVRGEVLEGITEAVTLAEFAEHHLLAKAARGKVTEAQLASDERHLRRAVAFLGDSRALTSIKPSQVLKWLAHLRQLPLTRPHRRDVILMSEPNVRHHSTHFKPVSPGGR